MIGLIAKFLPVLKGLNWMRIGLYAGLASAIFGMGYMKSNANHAEAEAEYERAKAVAIADRVKELNAEWNVRLHEEETARAVLQGDLTIIRTHRDSLIEAIRNTQLTRPIEDVNIEACLETDDENVKLVIANPFTPAFIGVWNDASRGIGGPGETAGPETD